MSYEFMEQINKSLEAVEEKRLFEAEAALEKQLDTRFFMMMTALVLVSSFLSFVAEAM